MTGFRFVHAADLHLDTPFEGLARTSPEVAAALRDASLDAFDALVELTLREDAAFLADRRRRVRRRRARGAGPAALPGRPAAALRGRRAGARDPRQPRSARRLVGRPRVAARRARVLPPTWSSRCRSSATGAVLATVHGISYARRDPGENLALRFAGPAGEGLQVGVLHCNVGADPAHAAYSPCSVDDLRRAGLDYWALGHVHQHAILSEGRRWVAYSGCLQGRGRWARELGPKGALVVRGRRRSRCGGVRHVALDRVRFELVDVDVEPLADLAALREHLAEEAAARRVAAPRARAGAAGPAARSRAGARRPARAAGGRRAARRAPGRGRRAPTRSPSGSRSTTPPRRRSTARRSCTATTSRRAPAAGRRGRRRPAAGRRAGRGRDAARGARAAAAALARRRAARLAGAARRGRGPGARPARERGRVVRITGWSIDGFGVFHDEERRDLGQGLTILLGPERGRQEHAAWRSCAACCSASPTAGSGRPSATRR